MEVKINKNVLLGICAALLVALLLISFLLGRESKKETVLIQEQKVPAMAPSAEVREVLPPSVQLFLAPSSSPAFFPQTLQTSQASNFLAGSTPVNATVSAEQEAVRNYFQQMDAIGASEEMSENPQEMATAMAQGAIKGDFSRIDDLVTKCERLRGQVQALSVPPPCTEFHRKTLEVLDAGIQLYRELKKIIQGGDISGVTRLAEQAKLLEHAAKSLDAMKKKIISRYK